MTADEADALAGEYVLGTLSFEEREAFKRALARDPALEAAVKRWELRLASLDNSVREEAPDSAVWVRVAANLPEPLTGNPAASETRGPSPTLSVTVIPIEALRRSRALWRGWALTASALAAGLAVAVALQQVVQPPAPPAQYLAVVNRGGDQPALIVRVDLASKTVLVRPVSTETPAGRSLELWVIGQGQSPKSLGVLMADSRRLSWPAVFGTEGASVPKATFAVTIEPPGGSPSGGPTGPVVYSGELIKE